MQALNKMFSIALTCVLCNAKCIIPDAFIWMLVVAVTSQLGEILHKEAKTIICSFTFQPQKEVHKEHEENNDSNDVFLRYESEKDVGMKEIKEKNELREQDSEMKESLTEWRDWSLQITDSCRLLITGKTNQ
jgi:hypothetical protein